MLGGAFKGMALMGLERYDEAIPLFTFSIDVAQAAHQANAASSAFLYRGMSYFYQDNLSAALNDLSTFIQMEPNQAEGYFCRGRILANIGDLDAALDNLNRAVSINPGDATNYAARGDIHFQRDDPTKAIDDLSRAIRLDPNNAAYYRLRADAHTKLNNTTQAIADYSRAIDLNPQDLESYKKRGALHQSTGDVAAASADLTRVSSEEPFQQAYNTYFDLANTAFNRGIKAVYTEADQHASTNWLGVFLGTLAIIAIGFFGLVILNAISRNSCFPLLLLVAVPAFIAQLFAVTIRAAKEKRTTATAYIQILRENEYKMPGFEEFFEEFLQAKKDSRVAELPTLTRSFFERGYGNRVVQQYKAGQQ